MGSIFAAPPLLYYLQKRQVKNVSQLTKGTWEAQTIDELKPKNGDLKFFKTSGSAMHNTVLDDILRINNIKNLLLVGILAEGCVLRTAVQAVQYGYYPVIIKDCISSWDIVNKENIIKILKVKFPMFESENTISTWKKIQRRGKNI